MTLHYISTRGGVPPTNFTKIMMHGLCDDGGLYVPNIFPTISLKEIRSWERLSYAELAFEVISRLAPCYPRDELKELVTRCYAPASFGTTAFAPLRSIGNNTHLLNVSTGPTYAFKDYAMQFIGVIMEHELAKSGGMMNILGATSGDTGSAAIAAFKGKKNIQLFMLSPADGMSAIQTAQMHGVHDPGICNIAVSGVFDDCQDLVKAVNDDKAFKQRYALGAVNSINWHRIAAQAVYYFWAYLRLPDRKNGAVSFAVPSGNFGNVYAGHVAKRMGLPISQMIVATNENNVLDEFIATGRYAPRRSWDIKKTSSPSMDIGKASNLERLLFELTGSKPDVIVALWKCLASAEGEFHLPELAARLRSDGFLSGSCSHQQRLQIMRDVFGCSEIVIDPHTANAVRVGWEQRMGNTPLICLETAAPFKFPETVREAIGVDIEIPLDLQQLCRVPPRYEIMENDATSLKAFIAQKALA